MLNKEQFVTSWKNLGAKTDPEPAYKLLHGVYVEDNGEFYDTRRKYHTAVHINEGIDVFKKLKPPVDSADEILMAFYMHDIVYDTKVEDRQNVKESADLAVSTLLAAGVSQSSVDRIKRLVQVTDHKTPPENGDEKVIIDMDLAILGSTKSRFREYEVGIEQEYHWVIDERGRDDFRQPRMLILQSFLNRDSIYFTDEFNKAFDARARRNIDRSINRLGTNILPSEKLGYYAGSFDPFTNGHLWVVNQAAKLFDALLIAPLTNPDKPGRFESWDRYRMILHSTNHIENVGVMPPDEDDSKYFGVSIADDIGADFLVRGLRDINDLDAEQKLVDANSNIGKRLLDEEIPQIHFVPPRALSGISSSMVMMHVGYKGWERVVKDYVPKPVLNNLIEKFGKEKTLKKELP